jgi:hypothetical protein
MKTKITTRSDKDKWGFTGFRKYGCLELRK